MNFVEKSAFGVKYWQIDSWVGKGFVHGFVGKDINLRYGSQEAEEFLSKLSNRELINLKLFKQIHSDIIIELDAVTKTENFEADAWLSQSGGGNIFLGIKTADCYPVIVFSPEMLLAANLHCGWRGTVNNLLAKTIKRFSELGANVEKIEVAIGPGAGECCYEVGEEVIEKVRNLYYINSNINSVLLDHDKKICCNIKRILELQALDLGVKK